MKEIIGTEKIADGSFSSLKTKNMSSIFNIFAAVA